jgi:hypothetical protein
MAAGAGSPTLADYLLTFFKEPQMGAHTTPTKQAGATWSIPDPGDAGRIDVRQSGVVNLVSGAAGETRTIAAPRFVGQRILLNFDTDGGGAIAVTVSAYINAEEDNTITFNDAAESIELVGVTVAGVLRWTVPNADTAAAGTNGPTLTKV